MIKLKDLLNEISAIAGLKDVMKGRTSAIEGVKMSKAVAAGLINWIQMSPYGKRYSNQIKNARIHSLIGPANSMGIDRYLGSKGKSEWKVLFAKHGPKRESVNESYNQSDVNYAMKMAFDSIPGNWHKALKRVKYSKRSKSIKLNMSSYMGPGEVLQKIVNEFNRSMGTKYKIDKDSFVKGSITSIELREK